jgi:dTMP kinase
VKGCFITLEGGEGAGKSTQAERLSSHLRREGYEVITTHEPGGTAKADRLRKVILSGRVKALGALAETLLFSAARLDHLNTLIRPTLKRGGWVICDRFTDSTRVYQGKASGVEAPTLDTLERVIVEETRPDLTLILDLDPKLGLARATKRGEKTGQALDRFEKEDLSYHQALRQGFLEIAAKNPHRCVVIDAQASAQEVEKRIWQVVEQRFFAQGSHAQ